MLEAIAALILRHTPEDGEHATSVDGLTLVRASSPVIMQRGLLRPSFCVVVQGQKMVQVGDAILRYGAGTFLASSIDMPLVGQVIGATRAKPFVVARFHISPADIVSVVTEAKIQLDASASVPATYVGTADPNLLDVILRSVRSLADEREARFLAPLLRRELIYRLVTGPSAYAVCQSAMLARGDEGVGRAVEWIKTHYKEPLSIAALAKRSNMSTSSLHHKFKAMVLLGPLQYQKRLRLEEARRLLIGGFTDATSAAFDVGYESPSQFIREYRRQFGLPPLRDVKRMREVAGSSINLVGSGRTAESRILSLGA